MPTNVTNALNPANLRVSDPSIFGDPLKNFPENRLFDQVRKPIERPSPIDAEVAGLRKDLAKMNDAMFYSIATAVIDPIYQDLRRLRSGKSSTGYVDACKDMERAIREIRLEMRKSAMGGKANKDAARKNLERRDMLRLAAMKAAAKRAQAV